MKIVLVSDTHLAHGELTVPRCDLLVHAGDFGRRGKPSEFEQFTHWFADQPAAHKVFVAGNHDFFCERDPSEVRRIAKERGLVYLDDETATVGGLRIHGSPITPNFRDMAFNRERGDEIARHWDLIPEGLDLLVTHGPPHGLGDRTVLGMRAGCEALLARVLRVRPKLHVFGHIHEDHGEFRHTAVDTRFLNVCSRRLLPLGVREPVVVEL